ncbi:hypothetical protein J2Y54_000965 [Sphingomonas sp. BE123]|uniref:hypothetical protein n=1 Tax=unclassified Sphingomonas TaxID=196159 RepID=UPI002861E77D|nr:hypothetical protein [Sphingomonas sp. BE123]MDR6851472.1 hypothetical protein [Sphingomonas sp. BE123]
MAIKALNGFGWFLTGVVVAPACYLVSSQVAAERSKVEAVERAIAKAHKDIRGLETEFDTRANLAQLERWNGEVMRYTAPTPAQFLSSDAELAALRPLEGDGMAERYAAMVVPQGMPDVVAGAAVASDAVAPARPKAAAAVATPAPVVAVARAEATPAPRRADRATAARTVAATAAPGRAKPVAARDEAVAALDRKLLKDSSFGDLMQGVRAEARKLR